MGLGIGGFDISSVASLAINVTSLSNPAAFTARCCGGGLMQAGEAVLQNLGEMMGLPQHSIDFAQGLFDEAFGNAAGAAANYKEAYQGLMDSMSPMDAGCMNGHICDVAHNTAQGIAKLPQEQLAQGGSSTADKIANASTDKSSNFNNMIGQQTQDGSASAAGRSSGSSKGSSAGNFLEVLAKAMGSVLGKKAGEMMKSMDALKNAGEGEEFSKAQAEFSGKSQVYGMLSNLTNTVIKTIGESMSTLARKS